jgi:hypothetical protein
MEVGEEVEIRQRQQQQLSQFYNTLPHHKVYSSIEGEEEKIRQRQQHATALKTFYNTLTRKKV